MGTDILYIEQIEVVHFNLRQNDYGTKAHNKVQRTGNHKLAIVTSKPSHTQ